jgi:ribose 5-phosphate isomerase RpiB
MRIAIVTEVSTKEKNKFLVEALKDRGHEIFNLGMKGTEGEPELTYVQTGFIGAAVLAAGCADLVMGGCGTGQGFLNSVMQYPGVFCGLVESPLDAWLFAQINGGNCVSLALNKNFGWAGEVNLRFIFDQFFGVELGCGYPEHRKASQQRSRAMLKNLSAATHKPMAEIVGAIDDEVLAAALRFPGVMEFIRAKAGADSAIRAACEKRLAAL